MVERLSEIRDGDGRITHKLCCICFQYIPFDELWVDDLGQRWDMCVGCGLAEQVLEELRREALGE